MKLNERLRQAETTAGRTEEPSRGKDPLAAIRERAQVALFAKVGARINDATISEDELAMFVADELRKVLAVQPGRRDVRRRLCHPHYPTDKST